MMGFVLFSASGILAIAGSFDLSLWSVVILMLCPNSPTRCIHHNSFHPNTNSRDTNADSAPSTPSHPFISELSSSANTSRASTPTAYDSYSPSHNPKPGMWNVIHIPDSTHVSLMPLWMGTRRQKEWWVELGEWLEVVDRARREVV